MSLDVSHVDGGVAPTFKRTFTITATDHCGNRATATKVYTWGKPEAPATFGAGKTTYAGLFYDPDKVTPSSAGAFTLTTTAAGKFTAKFQIGVVSYSASGEFDQAGQGSGTAVSRNARMPFTVQAAKNGEQITGTVGDGTWAAGLTGYRPGFDGAISIAPQAGQYTMVFPGGAATAAPAGHGYGTLAVDKAGRVRLLAVLGDTSKLTQTATISRDGDWPLYVPLSGGGLALSWVAFADSTDSDLAGTVAWIKPPLPGSKYYPGGFATEMAAVGSRFIRPGRGGRVLGFKDGIATLAGAGLTEPVTNTISIDSKSRGTKTIGKPNFIFTAASGLFKGDVPSPQTSKPFHCVGVVLQKQNIAAGFFPGGVETGSVRLQAEP